ncbi:folate receptor beta-like [Clavelina lepadiformis]|uniref:Folate receptor-like domain-containing protein n=1 Tax=Clavelina lepadiformis TaxID=159417 RepID=A0ABP0FLC0_CLALP
MYLKGILLCIFVVTVLADEDVLNTCLDAKYHKSKPSIEDALFSECSSWKDRSCCTNKTAYWSHQSGPENSYNFSYDHCGSMSDKCRRRFFQDNCFYECSPNVGPWIVTEKISYRNQRFKNVPICESSCTAWYDDCKNDLTCKDDWGDGWNWTSGFNTCPENAKCKSFSEIFQNATNFCQRVFVGDFAVVPKDSKEPCLVLWFDSKVNPNDEVARYYAKKKGLCCGARRNQYAAAFLLFALFLWMYLAL